MAYKFVEKRKTVQEEMAYIAYMIVGSYFNKAVCKNPLMANRLYFYYMEMKETTQEAKEKKVIVQAEKVLKDYESILGVMRCEIVIALRNNKYLLDFFTGFERVHVEVDVRGNCEIEILAKETQAPFSLS